MSHAADDITAGPEDAMVLAQAREAGFKAAAGRFPAAVLAARATARRYAAALDDKVAPTTPALVDTGPCG